MNVKNLFWRIWVGNKSWAKNDFFKIQYAEDMISGTLYAGVTVFGYSILYSSKEIMSKLVIDYIVARQKATDLRVLARSVENAASEKAIQSPLPKKLRPAVANDIVVGAVIWYPSWEKDDGRCWNIVDQVLRPNDDFMAYCAHEGCRYGLDGAFIEL